jgi:cell division protein ZapE
MTGPVGTAYAALVAAGELRPDADQQRGVAALDRFAARLRPKRGLLSRLLGKDEAPGGV